jgi:hypothetical protein
METRGVRYVEVCGNYRDMNAAAPLGTEQSHLSPRKKEPQVKNH